ncbi:ParB/RepB/Spo0J family partition protein [Streptomyces sp. MMBL 11-3]|uniref:ParB/RepB/Spo0J family partition protein n=1 Tax=Streptomyces sp. MMBL 11-3 TaxID=3382639 RepID=UPI0039B64FD9
MSKADKLGAGRFGAQPQAVSARRQAVAAATGVPTEGIAPPSELPVHRISLNPDNPRTSLGDLSDLSGSLKDHGQKVAITVMNRDAYVKANPEQAADLEPDTTHVVIDGSSRLAAAREAGLTTIKVMVSDEQGANAEELLESALVANIHRQDLDELDEARALERLLAIHGSQTALARRLHRSQGWVSQRIALLNLAPELQALIGQEPIDLLRAVGNKPADQQPSALAELKEQRHRKEAEKQERKREKATKQEQQTEISASPAALTKPSSHDEVLQKPAEPADSSQTDTSAADSSQTNVPAADSLQTGRPAGEGLPQNTKEKVPEPRVNTASPTANQQTDSRTPPKLPYDDGVFLAHHLIRKMTDTEFEKMLKILNELHQQRTAPTPSVQAS